MVSKVLLKKAKIEFDKGNLLKEQGMFTESIASYQKAIQIKPDYTQPLLKLAEIYEEQENWAEAVKCYQKMIALKPENHLPYLKLARVLKKQNKIDDAIAAYQKAIILKSEQPAWVYAGLGDALMKSGRAEEAIAAYEKFLEIKSDNPNVYLDLAQLYCEKGNLDRSIDNYYKAIKLKPNLPFRIYQKLAQALNQQGRKDEATKVIRSASKINFKDGETYSKIWNGLNQTSLKTFNEESSHYPTEINRGAVKQYFTQARRYKIINLRSLTEEDKKYIREMGLSLNYLQLNRAGLITKEGVFQEEPISDSLVIKKAEQLNVPSQVAKASQRNKFQLSMLQEGYIYAICPTTGIILRSNRSLFPGGDHCVFYRFVGQEIFYLVTGDIGIGMPKLCIYFPTRELIIVLSHLPRGQMETFDKFKTYVVTNWKRIESYVLNNSKVITVALISSNHFAHHLWNELSGIYKLHETRLLDKVDRFLVISEPLGCIDEIFPEISSEKIKRIHSRKLTEEILDNNYFVLKPGWNFIKENLADRIYQTSLKQCSSAFLAEVEKARKKHFPLLWITIRLGNRTWVSQTKGITNIVKSLSKHFPNLGVVIDGFSLPYDFANNPSVNNHSVEEIIRKEKKTVSEIQSVLPPEIPVYNTIGCMLYESIIWAYAIDFYVAHHGSIQHKVGWTANKPGIVHTNRQLLKTKVAISNHPTSWARENSILPMYISEDFITDVTENVKKDLSDMRPKLNNYDCDWRVIYEEAFKLALSIRDEKSQPT